MVCVAESLGIQYEFSDELQFEIGLVNTFYREEGI